MFPQVAPKFFKSRHEGPKNLGKDPEAKPKSAAPSPAAAPGAGGNGGAKGQLTEPINYVVTYAGKSHKVTVAPGS
jgi:methylmalonyl-CoA carboxyltransferase 5S subunit